MLKLKTLQALFVVFLLFYVNPPSGETAHGKALEETQPLFTSQNLPPVTGKLLSGFFVENRGQLSSSEIFYYGEAGSLRVGFGRNYVVYALYVEEEAENHQEPFSPPSGFIYVYRVYFEGTSGVVPRGEDRKSFYFNYFLGNDSSRWATFVPAYGEVLYENLYPGIDARFYFSDKGLKYDFIVHPGGEVERIGLRYEGADVREEGGELVVEVGDEMIREGRLYVYQEGDEGEREEVAGRYDVKGGKVKFEIKGYDEGRDLIIDPLVFSTYIGGTDYYDWGMDVLCGDDGSIYVVGMTKSTYFPTTPGAYDRSHNGEYDVFIVKLNTNANTLLYGTYIGGSKDDYGMKIGLGPSSNIYFSGYTISSDFPVTAGAYDRSFNGTTDVYVGKLSSTGSTLLFSTYIGGNGNETLRNGMEVDEEGNVYIGGWTDSSDFPVTNGSYDTTINYTDGFISTDGFILKLNASGDRIIYSTFLGGSSWDRVWSIRLRNENVYVAGSTYSNDFPTTSNAYQTSRAGSYDAFVSVLTENLSSLRYSTYFGGSRGGSGIYPQDYATDIDVDGDGRIYIAGLTGSTDLPTTPGAYDRSFNGGGNDAFVARFNSNLSTLLYSTYIGGSSGEGWPHLQFPTLKVSVMNWVILCGETSSSNFPVTADAFDSVANPDDGFLTVINETGGLVYSTFIGGNRSDGVRGEYLTKDGFVYLTGFSSSSDFPVTNNSYQTTLAGYTDAFLLKIYPFTPLPPVNLSTESANESIVLRWEANRRAWEFYPHGFHIYRAEMTEEGNTSFRYLTTVGNVTEFVDRNLTNRTTYIYAIRAYHWGGNSTLSQNVTGIPLTKPYPVQNLTVEEGNQFLLLKWRCPDDDGGMPITSYRIYRKTLASNWVRVAETGNVTEYNDTGLINGVTYFYIVRGVNEIGEGREAFVNGTPRTIPQPPENFQVIDGDGFVYLSWFRPIFNGGAPIINYTVFRGYSEEGLEPIAHVNATEGQRNFSYTDRDVVNGRVYYYAVAGVNEAGVGDLSEVLIGRPGGVPTAPRNLRISPYGNGSVRLIWEPPQNMRGYGVENYTIYRGLVSEGGNGTRIAVIGNVTEYVDEGLEVNVRYFYYVRAVNFKGEGEPSERVEVYGPRVPYEVRITEVVEGEGEVTLRWSAPVRPCGLPVTGYYIYRGEREGELERVGYVLGDVREYTDMGLENGRKYYYSVRAENVLGEGDFSPAVTAVPYTVPEAPENVRVEEGDESLLVMWEPPVFDGGRPVLTYYVYVREAGSDYWMKNDAGNVTRYLVEGLYNGMSYYVKVAAVNKRGVGRISEEVVGVPGTVPTSPQMLKVRAVKGGVEVSWKEPANDGGKRIRYYRVYRGEREGELRVVGEVEGLEYFDRNVTFGVRYYYGVSAVNDAGEGSLAVSTVGVVPFTVPSEPKNLSFEVEVEGRKVVLRWTEPESDGGNEIQGYRVYRSDDGEEWEVAGEVLVEEYEEGLGAGERRYYYVVAVNDAGEGERSEVVEVYYELPPGAPLNLEVEVVGGDVRLHWEEPLSTGGGIDGYVIYRKEGGGEWKEIGRVNSTEYVDKEVKGGRVYYYRVAGVNSGGVGEGAEVKVEIEGGGGGSWVLIASIIGVIIACGVISFIYWRRRGGRST